MSDSVDTRIPSASVSSNSPPRFTTRGNAHEDQILAGLGRDLVVNKNLLSIPNPSGSVSAPTGGSSHNGTGTSSLRRRLGKLGIPIDDDDDGDIGIDTEDERLMLEYQLAQDEEFGRASLTGLGSLKASDRGPSESDTESIAGNAPASLGKPNNIQTRQDASLAGARAAVDDDRVAQPGGLQRHPTGPTSWTEQSFRDIVDDLSRQNQQLKGKLRRYEAVKVPHDLRNERLFEVRFFQGLPQSRRQEIESFLTSYVQHLSGPDPTLPGPVIRDKSTEADSGSTSSLGVTLRSLRSSEKEKLAASAANQSAHSRSAMDTRSGSGSATGSGQGSGSGSTGGRIASGSNYSPVPVAVKNPPAVLRPSLPEYHAERDLLAAPSFSGVEPRSATGTGTGMRMSESSHRKRRRHGAGPSSLSVIKEAERTGVPAKLIAAGPAPPPRPKIPRRDGGEGEVSSSSAEQSPNAAELGEKVVELLEGLFFQSLPMITPSGVSFNHLGLGSGANEPSPRPAKSSSNQYYLRTLLDSDQSKHAGGWVFLNLVLGMAGVHRLNVSIAFIRHSIRTRSDKIELNEQGDKVRWVGPTSRVVNSDPPNVSGTAEQAKRDSRARHEREDADVAMAEAEAEREQVEDELSSSEGSLSSRRERRGMFRPDSTTTGMPSKDSTDATTASAGQTQSNNSKDKSRTNSGGGYDRPATSQNNNSSSGKNSSAGLSRPAATSLRANLDQLPSYLVTEDKALSHGQPSPPLPAASVPGQQTLTYIPLFGPQKSATSVSSADESEAELDQPPGSTRLAGYSLSRPTKRRKRKEGGLVFFASDTFCSDLAGDTRPGKVERGDLSTGEGTSEDDVDFVRVSRSNEAASRKSISASPRSSPSASEESVEVHSGAESVVRSLTGWSEVDGAERRSAVAEEDGAASVGGVGKETVVLSGMSDAVAADHFSILFKVLHPTRPTDVPAPAFNSRKRLLVPALATLFAARASTHPGHLPRQNVTFDTKIDSHLPAVRIHVPRVRMLARSDDGHGCVGGDGERNDGSVEEEAVETLLRVASSPEADYMMSLGLPLYAWAPEGRREDSYEEEDEWGEEKAMGGMCG